MEHTHFPEEPGSEKSERAFNGNTVILFRLDYVSDISIEIYDLKGNKCTAVSGKNLSSGEQQIVINTADLRIAPGNYVYHLQIKNVNGSVTECKTMVVV